MKHLVAGSVNIFIVKHGKVLLGRRKNTGWKDGHLCPPGGHVEPDETPTQAAAREVKEELGTTVALEDLEFLCVAARRPGPQDYVAYEFMIKDKSYTFTNAEPEKCSELVWVDPKQLPDDVIEDFRIVIEEGLLKGKRFLEIGY